LDITAINLPTTAQSGEVRIATRTGQDSAGTLTSIEKVPFRDVSRLDLGLGAPLPVKDVLSHNNGGQALSGAAIVKVQGDVLVTPDAIYTGFMIFKYKLQDAQGNFSEATNSATEQSEAMKAAVYLQTPDLPTDPLAHNFKLNTVIASNNGQWRSAA
jgi:hypothetical protein